MLNSEFLSSTGTRDRIQLSNATASLLREAGKEHWIEPREEVVNAKGKGLVNTFWVTRGADIVTMVNRRRPSCAQSDTERMSSSCASISATSNTSGSNGSIVDMSENSCSLLGVTILSKSTLQKFSPRSTDGKNCECIDWHVETMAAYLKRIVALRNCNEADQRVENPKDLINRGE